MPQATEHEADAVQLVALRSAGPPRVSRPPDRYATGASWATWRSGYAAACKAVYTGSIPVVAFGRVLPRAFNMPRSRAGRPENLADGSLETRQPPPGSVASARKPPLTHGSAQAGSPALRVLIWPAPSLPATGWPGAAVAAIGACAEMAGWRRRVRAPSLPCRRRWRVHTLAGRPYALRAGGGRSDRPVR